ncbi:uncharacterized protein [Temnothorax longispinosus]|uniref:uncharacterized protein isoform X1 n=1 Tax=Temnothorax longispinosus TaxID=300112 RepID=UPI003A99F1DB
MEQPAGTSTAKENLEDERKRLLKDEDFKGELTNALKYCNSLLQAKDLLTDTPPDKISSVSVAMGEVICEKIINILANRQIVIEEDLILFDENDTEGEYEECKINKDEDYEPKKFQKQLFDYIPLEYKMKTVALAEAHPKWSLANLHKKGCSRLKKKEDLKIWAEDVKKGGTHFDKWTYIDTETFERFKEARASYE